MSKYRNGTHVEVMVSRACDRLRRGDRGIVRGRERVDPGEDGYSVYNVELTDGRVVGLCSWEMNAMPDPLGETQLAMELEAA